MIYHETPSGTLHQGEVLDILRTLPDESVNCCVTSPPYWGLRDYGVDGQLGLERTPEEYVARMVEIFREVRRVLRKDGVMFLNLGDSYAGSGMGGNPENSAFQKQATNFGSLIPGHKPLSGLKPKDLVGIPWRVAFALQADGWYLRQDIIWHKPNPMPESVTDRCTKAHEYVFLMAKSAKYYYDGDAIKEPQADISIRRAFSTNNVDKRKDANNPNYAISGKAQDETYERMRQSIADGNPQLRNRRSVWTVTTKPFKGAHFATFPRDLIRPMIQAGCPEFVCKKCGKPRYPIVKNTEKQHSIGYSSGDYWKTRDFKGDNTVRNKSVKVGYTDCGCNAGFEPGVVLDPFMGSGTTAIEAIYQGKRYIGIDLNSDYCAMAAKRIDAELDQQVIDL